MKTQKRTCQSYFFPGTTKEPFPEHERHAHKEYIDIQCRRNLPISSREKLWWFRKETLLEAVSAYIIELS